MADFNPALPLPIKWSIGDDRFNEGQQVLSLTIPVDSVTHLIEQKVKTKCVQIYSKAVDGQFGVFGNINPQKLEREVNEELPF